MTHDLNVLIDSERTPQEIICRSGAETVPFQSILFDRRQPTPLDRYAEGAPEFYRDLHIDQIIAAVAANCRNYDITSFFYTPLHDLDTIAYRQEIMQDFENDALRQVATAFSQQMFAMRTRLPQEKKHYYRYHKERLFLAAVEIYCRAVNQFSQELADIELTSRGMCAFRSFLADYAASNAFRTLMAETIALVADLSAIKYCLLIDGGHVTVRPYEGEIDYTSSVERTFGKFRQGVTKDYRDKNIPDGEMNHIQAQVVEQIAELHPKIFDALDRFFSKYSNYSNDIISRYDYEVQFYLAYLAFVERLRQAGFHFCYPQLSSESKKLECRDSFDLSLAIKFSKENRKVVTNSFFLREPERVFVVSGPNQSGKTTFARTFGQLHYLAALGCLVPGTDARLFLFDRIFTHFERKENIETLRGKLHDDLWRLHRIFEQATPNSLIILNEIFSSTTLYDAVFLGRMIMEQISTRDLLGVCVTFVDELASLNEKTVSLVSMVDPNDPLIRTFRLERKPADGLAYALAIATKHRVTGDWLKKRIKE